MNLVSLTDTRKGSLKIIMSIGDTLKVYGGYLFCLGRIPITSMEDTFAKIWGSIIEAVYSIIRFKSSQGFSKLRDKELFSVIRIQTVQVNLKKNTSLSIRYVVLIYQSCKVQIGLQNITNAMLCIIKILAFSQRYCDFIYKRALQRFATQILALACRFPRVEVKIYPTITNNTRLLGSFALIK